MRILYFSKDYSTHDHRFLASLAQSAHQVFYLRLEHGARQVEDRPVPGPVRQVQWAGGRGRFRWIDVPRLALDLRRVIREVQPHLIHAGPVQSCAFLAALTGFRPLLTMSWGFDLMQDAERDWWWRRVTKYTLRRSTFFVSDAEITRAKAIDYGMPAACTAVFPWGVDLADFRPKRRRVPRSKGAQRPFVLFCNRSWDPLYGVDVLARAFVIVAREHPDVSLLLLGGGSQAQTIRQILSSEEVSERVKLPGQVSQTDLPRWYSMADLYISPSHVDGSSVSLMEALACGVPALVSDIPANKEWVIEGVNGWLFPDGDAHALARRIVEIVDRQEELAAVGQAARQTAEQKADWSKNFGILLEAYRLAAQAVG